ncbi:MAG: zinc-dependent alcohol dehydrogenase [Candidatus Brocadiia bacterium]
MTNETMLAAVLERPGQLSLLRIPVPQPLPDEVLVRVEACGVCGSDLRYFEGENPWAAQTLGLTRPNPPNMVLGHEVAGTIVAAGGAAGETRLGERVVLLAYRACGVCAYCRRGQHHLCEHVTHHGHGTGWRGREHNPGGLAEFCPVFVHHALPLPDELDSAEATLLDGLAVAIHAADLAGIRSGDPVAVVGSGPIGLCIGQAAMVVGAARVLAVDIADAPLSAAEELGLDPVDARVGGAVGQVLEAADTVGVAAAFDTVGTSDTRRQAAAMLRRGGRLLCIAGKDEELGIDYPMLTGERAVLTAANSPYPDLVRAIELARSGRVRLAPLITHRFPLDQVDRAFAAARNRGETGALKVVVRPAQP